MKKITDEMIIQAYNDCESIKHCATLFEISPPRVRKALSANDIICNANHKKIIDYRQQGYDVSQIAEMLNISEKTVQSYLPRSKATYTGESRVSVWRKKQQKNS